jgi:hypothetical protein
MSLESMPDERLTHYYENIRRQVDLDRPHERKLLGPGVREYADKLRDEIVKRQLQHSPIDWPRE